MRGLAPEWLAAIVAWARQEPRIAAVFLFGSRARGDHRPDSDLDIAVVLTQDPEVTASGFATFEGERLSVDLAARLPVLLDLQFAFGDDECVWPAVQREGVLLYAG